MDSPQAIRGVAFCQPIPHGFRHSWRSHFFFDASNCRFVGLPISYCAVHAGMMLLNPEE
jgi:hypothetical protein